MRDKNSASRFTPIKTLGGHVRVDLPISGRPLFQASKPTHKR
jgi:hypothetical protein